MFCLDRLSLRRGTEDNLVPLQDLHPQVIGELGGLIPHSISIKKTRPNGRAAFSMSKFCYFMNLSIINLVFEGWSVTPT
jgi:hypothetical protein